MGFLDRLLGRVPAEQQHQTAGAQALRSAAPASRPAATDDERAVARYRYLLRTAPPEQLEAMHAEAFAALTPEQRQQLLRELSTASPDDAGTSSEPADLARAATRAEMRRPGTLESTFSRGSSAGAPGMGSMFAGSMMGTVAGVVVGSAVANMLFGGYEGSPEAQEVGDTGSDAGGDAGTDAGGDTGTDAGGDAGTDLGGDAGGDPGYASDGGGGDWAGGGGDWGGGGDFGGGDIGGF